MRQPGMWTILSILCFGTFLQGIIAENCTDPTNNHLTCDLSSYGRVCSLCCEDGYNLIGPESITCICDSTTQSTPIYSSPAPGTDGGELYCFWDTDPNNIICAATTPSTFTTDGKDATTNPGTLATSNSTQRYVTWKDFWIVTGVLIIFVFLLLVATIFLLWSYFRRSQPADINKNQQPHIVLQNRAVVESEVNAMQPGTNDDEFDSDSDESTQNQPMFDYRIQQIGSQQPPEIPMREKKVRERMPLPNEKVNLQNTKQPMPGGLAEELQRKHMAISKTPDLALDRKKPLPLPKPDPAKFEHNRRIARDNPKPTTAHDKFGTVNSNNGYDNDPQPPELPPPNLPKHTGHEGNYMTPLPRDQLTVEQTYNDVI